MTFFPSGLDPRDEIVAMFHLVEITTTEGAARFMIGTDGVFTDASGNEWRGSQLFDASPLQIGLNGENPSGEVGFSYFQDPDAPDLIADLKSSGAALVNGQPIKFYVQPFAALADMHAPTIAPILFLTRTMRSLKFTRTGSTGRRIAVTFEGPWEQRTRTRRLQYTTEDHARLTGSANPSLELMPQDTMQDEKLFG